MQSKSVQSNTVHSNSAVKHPTIDNSFLDVLHLIRRAELAEASRFLPRNSHLLEFGGARGYQASLLTEMGHSVESIDILESDPSLSYFPVTQYDGANFPFPDATFDIVFSSAAITQVPRGPALTGVIKEMKRVTKPHGHQVHIIPTPTWRFWTSALSPFIFFLRFISKLTRTGEQGKQTVGGSGLQQSRSLNEDSPSFWTKLKIGLFSKTVTASSNVFTEWHELHEHLWRENFLRAGLVVEQIVPAGYLYTGHLHFKNIPLSVRRALARIFGSSCKIYVVKSVPSASEIRP